MIRDFLSGSRNRFGVVVLALLGFTSLLLSGCTIGPVEIGGPGGTPVPPTSTVPPPSPTPSPRTLSGSVLDASTGAPVANADVTAGGVLTETTAAGLYWFDDVPLGAKVSVSADGYATSEIDFGSKSQLDVKLRPNTLSGRVTDSSTGKPLVGALVKLVLPSAPGASPAITATTVPTATASISGTSGFIGGLAAPNKATGTPAPDTVSPTDVAATSTPLPPTATPTPKPVPPTGLGFVAVYTNEDGSYFFKDVPDGATLSLKMPGYKLTKLPVTETGHKDLALAPFKVEAAYITANIASSPDLYRPLVDFITKSRINAVVLNVQDDASRWVFNTQNPDVVKADATDIIVPNIADVVKGLHDKGIYVIARVVTFQQADMADARPDMAIKSSVTGKPWKGGYKGQQRWLDASNPATQQYVLDMTKEVLGKGFDEIQYDYVRFPSDPAPNEPGEPVLSKPNTDAVKAAAIEEFLTKAHALIEPTDAFMSIDIFGYTIWPDQEGKPLNGVIGQVFENMVDHADYISPMIYPSHFSPGEQGCPRPADCAYKLIHKSGEYAQERFAGKKAKYRPWLEDFDWPPHSDYTSPGTTKLAEQMQAAKETGAWGWMWWDASNEYQPRAAFKK